MQVMSTGRRAGSSWNDTLMYTEPVIGFDVCFNVQFVLCQAILGTDWLDSIPTERAWLHIFAPYTTIETPQSLACGLILELKAKLGSCRNMSTVEDRTLTLVFYFYLNLYSTSHLIQAQAIEISKRYIWRAEKVLYLEWFKSTNLCTVLWRDSFFHIEKRNYYWLTHLKKIIF